MILAQKRFNKRIYPVIFILYKNNRHKHNYPITDLKGFSVFWAVKKLKRYLREILFTIITDHLALKYIFIKDEIPEERRRW